MPITPATYSNLKIQNADNIYSGHTLGYSLDACRNVGDGVVTTITRSLVSTDDNKIQPIILSADTVTNKAGCNHVNRSVLLPYSIPTGKYALVIRGTYQILPLRNPSTVSIKSSSFVVNTTPIAQQIQDLINANNILQGQLEQEDDKTTTSTVAPAPRVARPTTNNTTNNNTTNNTTNNPPTSGGSAEETTPNSGIIDGIIKALGGGLRLRL